MAFEGNKHIVYTISGTDHHGPFQEQRRYKEVRLLRQVLVERFPAMYVPPIPPKKSMGNKDRAFIEDRCFFLNMFFKQMVRCPYLLESEEFALFLRPNNVTVTRALTYLPKLTSKKLHDRLEMYYKV